VKVSYAVGGLVLPARIGGDPVLDFCNTYAGWADPPGGPGGDYLESYRHLAQWVADAGLVPPTDAARLTRSASRRPGPAERVLDDALALRGSIYAVATAAPRSRSHRGGLDYLAAAAHEATTRGRLVVGEGWQAAGGLEQPFDAIALAAVRLLAEVPLHEIHACPGDGCGWVFRDASGRRRWCRMEWCGNRLKQRAHAARARQSAESSGPRSRRSARS
jgi:predicted RNA-binding Zn ribbon-like protein